MLPALVIVLVVSTQAPPEPTAIPTVAAVVEKPTVIVVDDRSVKDQAPAPFLAKAVSELERRRGMKVQRMSELRAKLDARSQKALGACGDDAGCLAAAGREMGGDIVVFARLTRREGAYFLALTRVSALRPQMTEDAATIAGTDADALAFIPEAVTELFPDAEIVEPRAPAPAGPGVSPVSAGPGVSPVSAVPGVSPVSAGPGVSPVSAGPGVSPVSAGPKTAPGPGAPR